MCMCVCVCVYLYVRCVLGVRVCVCVWTCACVCRVSAYVCVRCVFVWVACLSCTVVQRTPMEQMLRARIRQLEAEVVQLNVKIQRLEAPVPRVPDAHEDLPHNAAGSRALPEAVQPIFHQGLIVHDVNAFMAEQVAEDRKARGLRPLAPHAPPPRDPSPPPTFTPPAAPPPTAVAVYPECSDPACVVHTLRDEVCPLSV